MERTPRNLLLIELIIVIFFFALSAVITLQAFVYAYEDTRLSRQYTQALAIAQDWAEQLYAAADPAALLQQADWQPMPEGDGYATEQDGFHLSAALEQEQQEAGMIRRVRVTILPLDRHGAQEDPLVSIPVARYVPDGQEAL